MKIPLWLSPYLKDEGLERIEEAVHKAEKRTSGEIVPMVVRQSAATGHVALSVAALCLALAYGFDLELSKAYLPWGHWAWLPLDITAALFLGWALARLPWVRRRLTPAADRNAAVWLRAKAAFYERGLDRTKGSTGILLFISLADHEAVVLADKAIAKKLPPEVWDEVCEMLLRGARQRDLANGYQAAIAKCASLLEKDFKPKKINPNELKNALVIVD